MFVNISLNTEAQEDLDILGQLIAAITDAQVTPKAEPSTPPKLTVVPPEPEPAPAKAEPRKAAPAARKAAQSKPEPEASPEPEAEPTPEAEAEATEDLMGGTEYTREQVVARATELLSEQKTAALKAALAAVGAKRVSELKPEQFTAFMAELG